MPQQACQRLRLAICDDEPMDCALVAQMSREILGAEGVEAELSAYPSAAELLRAIRAGRAFHIFLLDVMMEGMDGMELAAALRAGHEDAAIIFISSNREMALRGYEVSALRYLAKPVEREKLREALLYCAASREKKRPLALPTASGGQSRVDPSAIVYVEAWERGVRLDLGAEKLEAKIPISQFAAMLPEGQFAYCHRTLLVNLAYVRHIRFYELELSSGERLPISKYRYPQFKSEFLGYLKG